MTTGQIIKFYRDKTGLSPSAAAAKARIGQRSWYEYEADETSPTVRALERIAPVLNVRVCDLVSGDLIVSEMTLNERENCG